MKRAATSAAILSEWARVVNALFRAVGAPPPLRAAQHCGKPRLVTAQSSRKHRKVVPFFQNAHFTLY
jgi:hypothetical protein